MSHVTASGGWRKKGKGVTCNGWEKVSHVTVSGASREKAKGFTCNGIWALAGKGERCHM